MNFSGLRAAFVFAVASLVSPVKAQAAWDLPRIQIHVLKQGLAADPQWAALLHLENGRPLVRDQSFLLSGAEFSPQAELDATLALLYGTSASMAVCRFPARYLWLKARADLPPLPLEACSDLQEFKTRAPMDHLSLVFASETLSQPSSMMGHLFLKLSGQVADGTSREHAVSFYTEPVSWNLPKLFYESLVKGMKGFFTLAPYQNQIETYIGKEGRSLWEYPVRLTPDQRELLQAHLIELKQVEFTYLFQRYNCATLVKHVLGVAQPSILQHKDPWTTPKDVVQAAQASDMLDTATALTAARWTLRILSDSLTPAQQGMMQRRIEAFEPPNVGEGSNRDAFVHRQVARAYNQHLLQSGRRSRSDAQRYQGLLERETRPSDENWSIETDQRRNPLASPPDTQVAVGASRTGDENRLLLELLPTSHRLEDRNDMYFNESSLALFDLALSQSLAGRGARLERATIYSMESLLPRDHFTGGWSGRFQMGMDRQWDDRLIRRSSLLVSGGLGVTRRWGTDIDAFAVLGGGLGYRSGAYLFGNPTVGVVMRQVFGMKSLLTYTTTINGLGQGHTIHEAKWTQSKYVGRNWTLVGSYGQLRHAGARTRDFSFRVKHLF